MYSNLSGSWISTAILALFFSCHATPAFSADDVQFSVVPDRCISLVRGQTCYQGVQFRWKFHDISNASKLICLWREGESAALTCWEGESEGVFRYKLEATETTSFHLVAGSQQQPIVSSAKVTISWVYNNRPSSRRGRWRLF